MAESERSELVQRLLAERKAKGRRAASSSPSTAGSRAERYQRIQKLLGERRAKLELEGCEEESQNGLLSPGGTSGFMSEARHSMAQSEGLTGTWTPHESTPGGPCLEYSFDDPGHIAAAKYSGASSRHSRDLGSAWRGAKTAGRTNSIPEGGKPGRALTALAGALLSPASTVSEEARDTQAASARRQLEWDARHCPYRSDSASSTQPRIRATRSDTHSRETCNDNPAVLPVERAVQESLLEEEDPPVPECKATESLEQSHPVEPGQPSGDDPRHVSHQAPGQQPSQVSPGSSACSGEEDRPDRHKTLKEKLFDVLRGMPEGPVELDPAMLYSPASSLRPPSNGSGAPESRGRGDASAASGNNQDQQDGMNSREIRLNSAQRGSSRAALAECILAERRREGTCRPHTNAARAGSHAGSQAGSQLGSEAATMEGTARLNRLAQPRTQLWEKCAQKKMQEQLGTLAECSFAPKTGRGPVSGSRAAAARLPAHVRLYANHSSKYKQWDRLKAEQEQEELQQCTFAPAVNDSRSPHTPLHWRLEELQRQRRERMAKLQAEAHAPAAAGMTFSPAVNANSERLALSKQIRELHDEIPAYRRLGALRRPSPKEGQGGNEELTFAPAICPASARLLEDSAQMPGRFLQRQRFFYDLKQQRMRVLQAEDGSECTFSPKTEDQSRAILAASSHADWLDQSSSDQVARLAVADKKRVEGARAAAAHVYYSQFTFQPVINERSKQLVREDRLAELASDDVRRARLEAAAAQLEAERERECTFRPALSAHPARLSDQENQDPAAEDQEDRAKRLEDAKRRRQAALEQQRTARENKELAECSFAPVTSRKPPPAPKAVEVHGMERYMRNKEHARRLEQEQRAREQKAFILQPKERLDPCTIPEPFALQTELRELETANRRAQLQASILVASMKECTFQPKTNEALNRKLLQAILQEEDEDPPESIASASTV